MRATGAALLASVGFLAPAALPAQSISANVNTNDATVSEPILLQVTVDHSQRIEPVLPELPDFRVASRGHSSQVQIVNGRMSSSITYNYLLTPLRTGTFTIGSASVVIDGETYRTRPFRVRVGEAAQIADESKYFFVRASVSETEPFVGQQILYTWRFYRRVQIGDARLANMDFGNLLAEDLGEVREYRTTVQGLEYLVSEIRKALFAQEAGEVVVPPVRLDLQVAMESRDRRRSSVFDDFFGRRQLEQRSLSTEPITLKVRPLPDPPDDFSGLVGSFELRSEISKRDLRVGESATLELDLSGAGNVQLMSMPSLPDLPQFKTYPDKPVSSVDRGAGGLRGQKTFRTALVPLQAGTLVVPAVDLVYFDPDAETYRTTAAREISLDVLPAAGKEELMLTESVAPTTGKVAVRILADDILPIHRSLDAVESQVPRGLAAAVWQLGWLVPPLAFFALFLVRRRESQLAADASLLRRRRALRRANEELTALRPGGGPQELARAASRLLRGFVGDKLAAEGAALTPAETQALLRGRGIDEATAQEVRSLLDRLEAAQFGAAGDNLGCEVLAKKLQGLLKRLDRQLRGDRR